MKGVVFSVLFLFLFACQESGQGGQASKPQPVRGLALQPIENLPLLELKHLSEGKVSIVNFWASWCVPCRAEHPLLMALADGAKGGGYRVLGLAYRDKPKDAARFLRLGGNPFAFVGLDRTGYSALGWGLTGVPETFVLDGAGQVIFHHRGPLTDLSEIKVAVKQGVLTGAP